MDRRPDKALAAIRHKNEYPLCCWLPGGAALAGPTGSAVTGWTVGRIRRSRHPASCPTRGPTGLPEKINALFVPPSARRYARSPVPLSPSLPG
ncbi:hypothetical protein FML64_00680 [Klebsiella quasipneumoniae]|nr:hypothetical protein [Klebsiella quasipneumoniae]PXH97862.1 hypothetical protein DMQ72_09720 [Klebsiella quasipneumoniae]